MAVQERNREVLKERTEELVKATESCFGENLVLPGLILLYTTIDIMGSLERSTDSEPVKTSFTRWVDKYLLPDSGLECTAIDLYGARCGLLHTYASKSKLSEKGEAKDVFYSLGSKGFNDLKTLVQSVNEDETDPRQPVAVDISSLFNAFEAAIKRFQDFLSEKPQQELIVLERVSKVFTVISGA